MRDSVADCGMNRVEFTDVGRCNVSGWNGAKSRGKTIRDRATCKPKNAILICPTSWTTLVNMYDARVSCYMWSMSRIIFIRHNEHDFLVPRLRNNGLEVVKGGLDLLTNFSLSLSLSLSVCVPPSLVSWLCARLIIRNWIQKRNEVTCSVKNPEYKLIHGIRDDTWKILSDELKGELLFLVIPLTSENGKLVFQLRGSCNLQSF